ncbi:MAG: hypothetical protein CFE27_08685 [Alphaproteobacteria bacterium PA1]|nr:MAG: hypothetical protein CFE27_08685 [Alphaproteobacteria bacterium PA1]
MKISTILDKIDEHQLFVPAFQREYVWKRDDAKELLDSLIKDYPTGTMLTWETNQPPELKGSHKYRVEQGAVRILLDGQQRITTLYMLIKGKIPPYYTEAEIIYDTRGMYVNLETRELEYYSKQKMQNDPRWQNITDVFQRTVREKDISDQLRERGQVVDRAREDVIDESVRAIERILDRDFPEQTIPIKANIREAIDIFYKVNDGGVALTEAELALAQISGYWPQARDLFKAKLVKLADDGFVFKLDFIVYALLACLHANGSDMRKLHGAENDAQIRSAWQRLDNQVLDYVVNLLRSKAYVDHTDEINSVYALIPIIAFCFSKNGGHLTETEISKVVKWFYYSQVRTRYISQLPQKLDRDLRTLSDSESPFDDLLRVIAEERPLEIVAGEFVGRGISHPLWGLMKWFFKSRNAVCFTTGVTIRKPMGKIYQLENDHIFPFSRLKEAGYGKENRHNYALAQEITNRAILTQVANRTKSDQDSAGYLQGVLERAPQALKLQSIPMNSELWELENYQDFLAERRDILAKELNEFLAGVATTEATNSAMSLEDMIAIGEADDLEFKATLRWDQAEQRINKTLEDVIVKTVAALGNGQGGSLLIGVGDNCEILGLERDYASLGNADKDKFQLHLLNLLDKALGQSFTTSKLKITFPVVAGIEICQVAAAPASKPLIIKASDKNGLPVEKFYVRNGNSSREMPLSEMPQYIADRFSK